MWSQGPDNRQEAIVLNQVKTTDPRLSVKTALKIKQGGKMFICLFLCLTEINSTQDNVSPTSE